MCSSDLLEDWTYEAAFAVISQPLKAATERGLILHSKVLDISHVDLAMGRVLEQGPVLVITFTAQQVRAFRGRCPFPLNSKRNFDDSTILAICRYNMSSTRLRK